ncbi:MAG: DNA mismatch repair protein MutS [Peptoniphilus sp.]|nr:DNA mismatch repair protein MutS [Peptoniphilus sp.]MDY3119164.1 DNA mismatch repair protein MutS [Peptoniphilus sp.]
METGDFEKLTPAMRHYVETKNKNPDAFLFYRLGDFYELFFDDALEVSDLLDLTLTKKSGGLEEKIPMCGVPYRVANQYVKRLVKMGYSVSICDQVEDPKEAKGLVKREITKIVTPGTFVDEEDAEDSRILTSLGRDGKVVELAHCDYPSGKVYVDRKVCWDKREVESFLEKQFALFRPAELLYDHEEPDKGIVNKLARRYDVLKVNDVCGDHRSILMSYPDLNGALDYDSAALANLLYYLERTQQHAQNHLHISTGRDYDHIMDLSETTIRNLELVSNNHDNQKAQSLYGILDHCKTKMGSRHLRSAILRPSMDPAVLNRQYDRIDALHENRILFDDIDEQLEVIYDIDRLSIYIANETLTPKQIRRLVKSLKAAQCIVRLLSEAEKDSLLEIFEGVDLMGELSEKLDALILEDAPANYREQRFIAGGVDEELDRLFALSESGKQWILQLEEKERDASGIKNLRVKYNKILGYFFEVSKSYVERVPKHFIRKQTLVGSERFFTEELKDREEEILHGKERALQRQLDLLESVQLAIRSKLPEIQTLSEAIQSLDMICALAEVADLYHYCRPRFNKDGVIDIRGGRHPVVEQTMDEPYIPNDTYLDEENVVLQIITGPNMAGKSTYMRQVALIQIMAQIGSFVPSDAANLPVVDQIFTRIGASDYLSRGQSTFMVEMTEVAEILRLATPRSLILFDEVGRGTSTYDGLSIAWSIIEYIYKEVHAKTLFATHYFELTELEEYYDGIVNVTVATEEVDNEIRFLRKIVVGQSNYSFGIDVAKLAGVKEEVIERAREVLAHLESTTEGSLAKDVGQISFVSEKREDPLREKIRSIDINKTTPLEALILLESLKEDANA